MLKIAKGAPIFPWKTVKPIDAKINNLPYHIVTKDGLINPSTVGAPLVASNVPLRVSSSRFGGQSTLSSFHPAIQRFIGALKKRGVAPEYEWIDGAPDFAFWFDLSTKRYKAYYVVYTMRSGQEIIALVFCSDPAEVMTSVQLIDASLYSLIRQCRVPKIRIAPSK